MEKVSRDKRENNINYQPEMHVEKMQTVVRFLKMIC